MHVIPNVFFPGRWPLSRVLVLVLAGAFAGLMGDLRVEHVDVVRENGVGWLPILYSGFMIVACVAGCVLWNRTARLALLPLFALAFAVGGMGFYFHNQGQLVSVIHSQIAAWKDPNMSHPDGPPHMAPLAFAGLGLLGVLASLQRFAGEAPSIGK